MKTSARIGIIGGGLMGRELASAVARWFVLDDFPVRADLVAVADVNPAALEWFHEVPGISMFTTDYEELLSNPEVEVVYAAVPHDLHEPIYCDVLKAGRDLLAEKPFGIDHSAAERIASIAQSSFVRCSSEFPFYPGAQRVLSHVANNDFGELLEVNSSFLHCSDLDLSKPINWKRQSVRCGRAGVMNDLGLHVLHLPLRLGLEPVSVYAQLQDVVQSRPDGQGGMARCDTWDNATVHCTLANGAPMRLETKRLAPGETNTWKIEVIGSKGGARFSTKEPKTLWTYSGGSDQAWSRLDLGHRSVFPVVTGAIFEFGFPDALLQMLAAFLAERAGALNGLFGCATVAEAVRSHQVWQAALESHETGKAVIL